MTETKSPTLLFLCIVLMILCAVIAGLGLFYDDGGQPYDVINQYGDTVRIYGNGIYAHDSYFKAPINRGTDFTMLFITVPLLAAALIFDVRRNSFRSRLSLFSILSVFTYYSASIAFGVTYNVLHLIYCAQFSVSLFALALAFHKMDVNNVPGCMGSRIPYMGMYIFLTLTGVALIAAWLPDIISAMLARRSLSLIEIYTTEITYVLDMAIIGPLAFVSLFLLRKRDGSGYVISAALLTLCAIVGIMVVIQSAFQYRAGINIPPPVLITKAGTFFLLSAFALILILKIGKSISGQERAH